MKPKTFISKLMILAVLVSACNSTEGSKQPSDTTKSSNGTLSFVAFKSQKKNSVSFVQKSGDNCNDILVNGVMNIYNFHDKQSFKLALKKLITMSKEQLEQASSSQSGGIDGIVPMAGTLVQIGASYGDDSDELKYLNQKYSNDTNLEIEQNDEIWLEQKLASPIIVNAWSKCMEEVNNNARGFSAIIVGDPTHNFQVHINWFPKSQFDPNAVKILNITTSPNIAKSGQNIIKPGATLLSYTGLTQNFKRTGSEVGTITIDIKGFSSLIVNIEKVPPPAAPKPVFENKWSKVDENGVELKQTFVVQTENCEDCGGLFRSGQFSLDDKKGKIFNVTYECAGYMCGWSYNPDGGQGINYKLVSNTDFMWFRKWDGGPHTEIYTAYYEKLLPVCVSNCQTQTRYFVNK